MIFQFRHLGKNDDKVHVRVFDDADEDTLIGRLDLTPAQWQALVSIVLTERPYHDHHVDVIEDTQRPGFWQALPKESPYEH